jgi:UDP-2,3-diacylglucosamine pyrophosphatase LpxH
MLDAIVLSDIHLGSGTCQAEAAAAFLHHLPASRRLIVNGDLLEGTEYRLGKKHWRVLSCLRKLSDKLELVWVRGNHDPDADDLAHLLGAAYVDDYRFRSGGREVLCVHGDEWDNFLTDHPVLSVAADWVYLGLQRMSRRLALRAKRRSKTFVRCAKRVEAGAVERARKKGCDVVCCGHTHHADASGDGSVRYYNSGCWTETTCTYLAVSQGRVDLRLGGDAEEEAPELLTAAALGPDADDPAVATGLGVPGVPPAAAPGRNGRAVVQEA